jgi:hypothetical protein
VDNFSSFASLTTTSIAFQGWLLGYQMAFDTGKSKLTKNNFALGYSAGDLVIHTNVNDGQVLQLSMLQQKVHLGITSDSIGL